MVSFGTFVPALLGRALLCCGLASLGCTSKDSTTIQLVMDEDAGTFTQVPVPTTLRVDAVEFTGDGGTQTVTLAQTALPATTLDLGFVDESTTGVLTVWGLDMSGAAIVYGASPGVGFGNIANGTISIFVQRTGEFARLPNPLSDSRQAPTLAVLQGRYLFVGAGSSPTEQDASFAETTQLYDFLVMAPLGAPPTLPRVPQSIAFDSTVSWLMDQEGGTYFDFSDNYLGAISLPSGSFADVAGGATVIDENGAEYVVAATRATGPASANVLKIDPNDSSNSSYPYGNPSWLTLAQPRLGAAAAWVTGRGLVVAGGAASGAGVEIVASGTTAGTALPYPADSSTGSGAAMLDSSHVLLAGGLTSTGADAGVRVVDLGCAAQCSPLLWPGLPAPITNAQVFVGGNATTPLVVGSEPSTGTTHVYRLSVSAATEIPTRMTHVNARAAVSPTGTIVLFGGAAEIESFTP
jgi:hypothetical protein